MRKFWTLTLVAVLSVAISGAAVASPTIYFNEANYLNDLSLTGAAVVSEGFEGTAWDGARYPTTASSVVSQGYTWTGGEAVTTGNGWARTGNWGIFDSWGSPDQLFTVTSIGTQVGFGGWFENTTAQSIEFSLDQDLVYTFGLGTPHAFFGVIDTDGFDNVAMRASNGHWGADDFTFGTTSDVIPEPGTLMLVGLGLAGLGARIRRKRS
ncbi:MAG: PEP-CTERM sorting domain-containing protein [FCB group bacterium]|nr:PEP-CTERM sorting domain-containing protein [FCB group bacterium]